MFATIYNAFCTHFLLFSDYILLEGSVGISKQYVQARSILERSKKANSTFIACTIYQVYSPSLGISAHEAG